MRELVEFWLFIAFVGMLLLLRFDAFRFGVAEYDDAATHGGWRGWLRRLSFYALGVALVLLIYTIHPQPISVLHLDLGQDRQQALLFGLLYGLAGTVAAFTFAWWRYHRFRLPSARAYPGAIVNSLGTAFLDEALFRGVILGLLLSWGWPPALAIAFETVLYGLATRLGAPGRSRAMLLFSLGVGVVGGLLVVETLGIGAAVLGHAITRFAIFLATGHAGAVRAPGWEPEEIAAWALPPAGWDLVAEPDAAGPTPPGLRPVQGAQLPPRIGGQDAYAPPYAAPPGYGQPYDPGAGYAPRPGFDTGQGYAAPPQPWAPEPQPWAPEPQPWAPEPQPWAPEPQPWAPEPQPWAPEPQPWAPEPTAPPADQTAWGPPPGWGAATEPGTGDPGSPSEAGPHSGDPDAPRG